MRRAGGLALLVLALLTATAHAAAPSLVRIASADTPVAVMAAPGDPDRLFVVEKPGRIAVLRNGVRTVFADLTDRVRVGGAPGDRRGAASRAAATVGALRRDGARDGPAGDGHGAPDGALAAGSRYELTA